MWELISIVIPKIKLQWKYLAYCMRYNIQEVEGFKTDKGCCISLFNNWLSTNHGPKPKTYQTVLASLLINSYVCQVGFNICMHF